MNTSTLPVALNDASLYKTQSYLNGTWVGAQDNSVFPVDNPATGKTIAQVSNISVSECENVIEAASTAMAAWRARTGKERAQLLRRWFDRITANADDLARLITLEQGKPLAEAKGEVTYGASFVEWFAEQAKRISGDLMDSPVATNRMLVMREPIGVCAAITPWNFPIAMITRKVAPALAAGCTVILKPPDQPPRPPLPLPNLLA